MSDTGWKSPGTVVSDDSVGTTAWSNPSNATASDDNYAVTSHMFFNEIYYTEYLKATNFGFGIPSGSTIDGIEVGIEMLGSYDMGDSPEESEIKIVKSDGTVGATNKSTGASIEGEAVFSYGGSSDKWGETWSASDINDTDFGVVFSGLTNPDPTGQGIYVDHIQIKVYYTESSTPTVGTKYPLPAFKRP
jgi:hypothetical protein